MCASLAEPQEDGDKSYIVQQIYAIATKGSQRLSNLLLLVYNPWGLKEWKGDFSKDSQRWDHLKIVKNEIYREDLDDAMLFWINIADYLKFFGSTVVNYYIKDTYSRSWIEDFHLSSMFEFGTISFHVEED